MDKQTQYIVHIHDAIMGLFEVDRESSILDPNEVDGTQFFTAYVKAGNLLYDQLTGNNISHLDFTHLLNNLIVQNAIEQLKESEES